MILKISYFNIAFAYISWQGDKKNHQDDGFQELRLNSYTLSLSNLSTKFLFLFDNIKLSAYKAKLFGQKKAWLIDVGSSFL